MPISTDNSINHAVREMTDRDKRRFWAKVCISDHTTCWEWIAHRNKKGYGDFRIGNKKYVAHRVAYIMQKEELAPNALVLHHCDNPACVRASHMFVGSNDDNIKDKMRKNRQSRTGNGGKTRGQTHLSCSGEKHPNSKLSTQIVQEIRRLALRGITKRKIGERFGLAHQYVSDICNRKVWKHVK